ncbi:NUDIX hydrolase [Glycomyces harbinensis]|uniref:ADP-ribose pyrophosphatase n=1 Tax=Glycomyces harbinensis TaxID=58114 RepID=A0A1G7ARB9_9ACTN|nr:NUDIX hydrolase [Glycomyces harbinensis]SDE17240.1 ADP-ribose pyrophosphatase [Glycomyces harbinensis]
MTPDRRRYDELRETRPELFANPAGSIFTVLHDPESVSRAESEAAERLRSEGRPEDWAKTGVVYEDVYGLRLRDAVRFPDGSLGTYIRDVSPQPVGGVVVLPVLNGDIVLLDHFRHATRTWHLELPRGGGEPGASPAEDARRELEEEIGAKATTLVALGELHPDTGMAAAAVALFYAEIDGIGEPEAAEGIDSIRLVPPQSLRDMIRSGEVTDGFTMAAYLRATLHQLLP